MFDAHRHGSASELAVARVKLHGKDPECVFFSVRGLAPRHCLRHIRHLLERRARKDEICRTSIYSVHGARDGLWEGGTNSALVATTPLTRVANSGWQLAPSRSIESRRRHRLRVAMRKVTMQSAKARAIHAKSAAGLRRGSHGCAAWT